MELKDKMGSEEMITKLQSIYMRFLESDRKVRLVACMGQKEPLGGSGEMVLRVKGKKVLFKPNDDFLRAVTAHAPPSSTPIKSKTINESVQNSQQIQQKDNESLAIKQLHLNPIFLGVHFEEVVHLLEVMSQEVVTMVVQMLIRNLDSLYRKLNCKSAIFRMIFSIQQVQLPLLEEKAMHEILFGPPLKFPPVNLICLGASSLGLLPSLLTSLDVFFHSWGQPHLSGTLKDFKVTMDGQP